MSKRVVRCGTKKCIRSQWFTHREDRAEYLSRKGWHRVAGDKYICPDCVRALAKERSGWPAAEQERYDRIIGEREAARLAGLSVTSEAHQAQRPEWQKERIAPDGSIRRLDTGVVGPPQ